MTVVHIELAATHALVEGSTLTMLTGWLPEEYVVRHQAKWYEQIRRRVSE